jgi:hypothetical protein
VTPVSRPIATVAFVVLLVAAPAAGGAPATGAGPSAEAAAPPAADAATAVPPTTANGATAVPARPAGPDAPLAAANETPADAITNVTVTPLSDEDVDGAAAAFEVTIRANTTLADTDVLGNNPGEPYLEIEVDGDDVAELKGLERTDSFATTVTITAADLSGYDPGGHSLTVELWDRDGGSYDATDLGNDDKLDERTVPVTVERTGGFDLEAGRTSAPLGGVVSLRALGEFEGDVTWSLVDAPAGSDAGVRPLPNGATASLRPDAAGDYVVGVRSPDGNRTAAVTVTATDDGAYTLLRTYAPRLHYHRDETYRPTRYEAFVHNATLEDIRSTDVEDTTMFDLAGRGPRWELDLDGDSERFRTYDDGFPPTVYGSVHRDVQFRGENYTALTYWLFYVYDPKQEDSVAALLGHQSDLETVTLLLQDGDPQWVGASQHYGGELRRWKQVDRTGSHPEVYPALGAHSNYLRNTARFDAGIPIQQQFINHTSRATSLVEAPVVDYRDRTGDAVVLTPDGSGDGRYEVVPLTGTEVWASYDGAFGPEDDVGKVPMRRTRWQRPGEWMATAPVPADEQVDGSVRVRSTAVEDGTVTVAANVSNAGPKPSVVHVVLEARPADADWNGSGVAVVTRRSVPLAAGAATTLTVEAPVPEEAAAFRLRAVAGPSTAAPLAALDAVTFDAAGLRETPTPDPSPTPTATGSPESLPAPGFGPVAALAALLAALAALSTARGRR